MTIIDTSSPVTITIGWTKHDSLRPSYMPFHDEWQPGQQQHEETITVQLGPDNNYSAVDIAELVFIVLNSPGEPVGDALIVRQALDATGFDGSGSHYSLSTGDTVTVGPLRLSCARFGWKLIDDASLPLPIETWAGDDNGIRVSLRGAVESTDLTYFEAKRLLADLQSTVDYVERTA
jgi:hypothetical protein